MKKEAILILVVVVLILGVYFVVFNSSEQNNLPDSENPDSSSGNNIKIINFAYSPSEIIIKKGDSVTWKNYDSVEHTVTSDIGDFLNSELFGQGESYTMTFTEAGDYNYHCTPHPYMKGRIIVK